MTARQEPCSRIKDRLPRRVSEFGQCPTSVCRQPSRVRNLDETTVRRLRIQAAEHGHSAEAQHQEILRVAPTAPVARPTGQQAADRRAALSVETRRTEVTLVREASVTLKWVLQEPDSLLAEAVRSFGVVKSVPSGRRSGTDMTQTGETDLPNWAFGVLLPSSSPANPAHGGPVQSGSSFPSSIALICRARYFELMRHTPKPPAMNHRPCCGVRLNMLLS